jgi:glycosyltransferase involved in cell wall biosynthesis
MAMSKPMVSFDLKESRAAAGDAALFAADVDGFAALIDELLDDPARRETMGAAGRVRAEATLAWEHQERALLAAYERALGKRRAPDVVAAASTAAA